MARPRKSIRPSGLAPLPSREQILEFLRQQPGRVGKREIARAFGIHGAQRQELKDLIAAMKRDGSLEGERRRLNPAGPLPAVAVLEVSGLDSDGELLAKPASWSHKEAPPKIYVTTERRSRSALAMGERILARLKLCDDGSYEANVIRVLEAAPRRIIGIYETGSEGGRLRPTEKRARSDFVLRATDAAGAKPGELVLAELKPGHPRLGLRDVRVIERLGRVDSARALSLIAIHEHGLPTVFAAEALAEAEAAQPVPLGERLDLRALPLVTIDGADARDFDDAVWAESDPDPNNRDGWHLIVAIADVAHYVRPGSALDQDAYQRGNSAYFPDRVVPMLPEALSNGWCSLKPGEERGCLVAEIWIDAKGEPKRHRFHRGLMRSAARLTYEQVEAAHQGETDRATAPLVERVIRPLYGAYRALAAARAARGTLELEIPERKVLFDDQGEVSAIVPRERLDSHKLIEELMIAANVAAASELEARRQPCMYRIHEPPDPEKLDALREVLEPLGLRLARGQVIRPRHFAQLLEQAAARPEAQMVSEIVLRSQSQAVYSPDNRGHFGLALTRYAHFTSPIRRYADLLVHRALIAGLKLGAGALPADASNGFEAAAGHISATERRAIAAERDAVDRFTASYLSKKLGAILPGRVNGVTRFGLFVTLSDSGADGLIPISTLPQDYYDHDAKRHALIGRRWGRTYRLSAEVMVRVAEAIPETGGIIFELLEGGDDSGSASGPGDGRSARAQGDRRPHPKKGPGGKHRSKRRKVTLNQAKRSKRKPSRTGRG